MKEAIQQYIEELHNKVKDFKEGRETDDTQYIGEYTSLINETLRTIDRLENILLEYQTSSDVKVRDWGRVPEIWGQGGIKKPLVTNCKIPYVVGQALIDNVNYCTVSKMKNIIDTYNNDNTISLTNMFLVGVLLGKTMESEIRYFDHHGAGNMDLVGEIETFIKTALNQKPLSKNELIDTEETKTENWRLTKYP